MGKFGRDKRQKKHSNEIPGPGTYTTESVFLRNIRKSKGTSLYFKHKDRIEMLKDKMSPDLGTYNMTDLFTENKKKNKGYSI